MLSDETPYCKVTGSFILLSSTYKPGIAYAVGYLSRFMRKPALELWKHTKFALR